ncbi:thiol-disulfide oxidoreductase DCC family protein [Staphylococcus massiliensis]|uniref:Thiol-disulfide oxidoreductase n=1 Tax=Staphylococcus massiliensis S46 TaxID=1229783 RepID=K9AED5_9STAP|nr:DCC1-like thiol-disulfide oxidoreductase family protein [Staphylococcus massiliensis]EKU45694.1 hypothetical protein C273_10842 [Staphylococcus massiliensis S46]
MAIIYYDKNCVYCYNFAIWLIQNGLPKHYEIMSLKGDAAQHLFDQHPEAKNRNSVIVQEGDHLYYKSTAIAHLIKSLSSFKLLGYALWMIPKPIRDFGYNLFANNRDKMWHAEWHQPTKEERAFFTEDKA